SRAILQNLSPHPLWNQLSARSHLLHLLRHSNLILALASEGTSNKISGSNIPCNIARMLVRHTSETVAESKDPGPSRRLILRPDRNSLDRQRSHGEQQRYNLGMDGLFPIG